MNAALTKFGVDKLTGLGSRLGPDTQSDARFIAYPDVPDVLLLAGLPG
jgi:hypothetical protein